MAPEEQDFLAAAGITDADFEAAPVAEAVEPAAEPVAEATTDEAATGPARDEHGRFAAKAAPEDAPATEAPVAPAQAVSEAPDISAQFNDETARAAWATVPAEVKSEVARRFSEMEKGISDYRQRMEPIRRFDEMARASGTTLDAALANYTNIEQAIARNPVEGLDLICRNLGTDIRSVAAHIMGQAAPEPNAEVAQIRQKLNAAEQELQGFRAERERTVSQTVQDFAKEHPRFDELSPKMKWLLETGGARDLADAYRTAELLHPLPASPQTAVPPPAAPQTPPANLSISGSPAAGSNPATATPALRGMDATRWAFEQAGL